MLTQETYKQNNPQHNNTLCGNVLRLCVRLALGFVLVFGKNLAAQLPVGIINDSGSSCYLSAVLQCVLQTATAERLLASKTNPCKPDTTAYAFYDFVHQHSTATNPTPAGAIADHIRHKLGTEQQDTCDAFRTLMTSMYEDVLPDRAQARTNSGQPLFNSFVFHQAAQLNKERHTAANLAYYLGPLQPQADVTLTTLIADYFSLQQTDTVTKQDYFRSTPTSLCIYLQRLKRNPETNNYITLNTNQVSIPELLDLAPISYPLPPEQDRTLYQLVGFVKFIGNTTGGHYVAYVRDHETWYLCNDSKVTVEQPDFSDPGATLLFYELVSQTGTTSHSLARKPTIPQTNSRSWWTRYTTTLASPRTWLGLAGLFVLTLFIGDRTGTF